MHIYCLWVSASYDATYSHTVICLQTFYCIIFHIISIWRTFNTIFFWQFVWVYSNPSNIVIMKCNTCWKTLYLIKPDLSSSVSYYATGPTADQKNIHTCMIYTSSNLYISYLNSFSIVIIKLLWNSIINYLTNTSVKPASKKDNIL